MSTMQEPTRPPQQEVSGWALGGIAFAATIMTLIGVFQSLAGLVAIFNDEFYVVARNYTFDLDVSAWGWIHLLIGLAILATGLGLFARRAVGRGRGDHSLHAERDQQLLLHPLLPDLVPGPDRPRRLGHLGGHAPRRDRDLVAPPVSGAAELGWRRRPITRRGDGSGLRRGRLAVAARVPAEGAEADRQRQPVREQPVRERGQHRGAGETPASVSIAVRPASTNPSPPGVIGIWARIWAAQNASSTSDGRGCEPTAASAASSVA